VRIGRVARHHRDDRDQRDDRQILEQQDREARSPNGVRSRPADCSIGSTCAVEDKASGRPSASAAALREAGDTRPLPTPRARTARPASGPAENVAFSRHSRLGLSSSPTRNSSSVMPSSAMPILASAPPTRPAPAARPARRRRDNRASHRARAAEQQDEDERRAEHDDAIGDRRLAHALETSAGAGGACGCLGDGFEREPDRRVARAVRQRRDEEHRSQASRDRRLAREPGGECVARGFQFLMLRPIAARPSTMPTPGRAHRRAPAGRPRPPVPHHPDHVDRDAAAADRRAAFSTLPIGRPAVPDAECWSRVAGYGRCRAAAFMSLIVGRQSPFRYRDGAVPLSSLPSADELLPGRLPLRTPARRNRRCSALVV
jgi:hypothetical protein